MSELFGDKYHAGIKRYGNVAGDREPCAACGKTVRLDLPHWTIEFDGQGFYAIGPECRKLFPDAVRVEAS